VRQADEAQVADAAAGSAQLEHAVPITPEAVFHVASVTKQFTAFAVALLDARGALSLEDDVRTHIPEVSDLGRRVTLRQLVHHTSGIRDQWELLAMAGWRLGSS
jgi:CubicO group peptidase (beta-lactamase class C family)